MKITEVAAVTGVHPKMIRHYQVIGLIPDSRTANNYRAFTEQDVERLRAIGDFRRLNLPLSTIKAVLDSIYGETSDPGLLGAVRMTVADRADAAKRVLTLLGRAA